MFHPCLKGNSTVNLDGSVEEVQLCKSAAEKVLCCCPVGVNVHLNLFCLHGKNLRLCVNSSSSNRGVSTVKNVTLDV